MAASDLALWIAAQAVDAAEEKLADDVVVLDVSDRLALADVFVICTAANEPRAEAIARNVRDRLTSMGCKPLHAEGRRTAAWTLLDYGDVVIHMMRDDARDYYRLERLWKDCPVLDLRDRGSRSAVGPAVVQDAS